MDERVMMMTKVRLFIFGLVLCLIAAPARADLFGFSASNPRSTFDGVSLFKSFNWASTSADLYRNSPSPTVTASFGPPWGAASFLLTMTISSATASAAVGSGSLTFKDVDGDYLQADVSGTWVKILGFPMFSGPITNMTFHSVANDTFDGTSGDSVSMIFTAPQPWEGAIFELTTTGGWFTDKYGLLRSFDVTGGSIDDGVVPVPAAFLLGLLGLGAAGLKLRKFA